MKFFYTYLSLALATCLWVTDTLAQNPKWNVVVSSRTRYTQQTWKRAGDFPSDWIREKWDQNYHITDVAFGGEEWVVSMSKNVGYSNQAWKTEDAFPEAWIRGYWDKDYDITELAYNGDEWSVVMSENTGFSHQVYNKSESYPVDWIRQRWNQNYHVTSIDADENGWITVMSKGLSYKNQSWKTSKAFPVDWVQKKWSEGFDITTTTYTKGIWVVVMSQGAHLGAQSFNQGESFPYEWIDEKWDEGFWVQTYAYGLYEGATKPDVSGGPSEAVVVNNPSPSQNVIQPVLNPSTPTRITDAPNIYAVIVGVAAYNHIHALNYTDDDAYRMYAFLKSPEGGALPDDHIQVLVDESATRSRILKAMRDVYGKAGPNDMILFYFSGHGFQGAFLPYDYNGSTNVLAHTEISKIFHQSKAKYKLCVADACHSGSLSRQGEMGHAEVRSVMSDVLENFYSALDEADGGMALLMSSKAEETSIEVSGLRQGVFSYYLIDGLKGAADANQNKIVTIRELYSYVRSKVRSYTNNRQSPVINGDFDDDMPVSARR